WGTTTRGLFCHHSRRVVQALLHATGRLRGSVRDACVEFRTGCSMTSGHTTCPRPPPRRCIMPTSSRVLSSWSEPPRVLEQVRVLLAEEDDFFRWVLDRLLAESGYEV